MRTNRPSCQKHVFPYFLDLVEDNVRNRCLFPLVALALYVLLVITIITSESAIPQPPSQIKSRLPFQDSYIINSYFNETFPTPRILITNTDGSMANQTVTMKVTDILTSVDGNYPICDAVRRKGIPGSLEFIRLKEVCRVEVWNKTSVSDSQGQAQYEGIKFARAPQGTYYFNFIDSGNNTESEEYTTFLQTTVIKLKVLSGDPPLNQNVGIAFATQPQILVLDQNGIPVAGKTIVAFSWPEPQFSGTMTPYLIESSKFAWLEGDVSLPSNASGVAKFTNLTIKGSNSQYVYIYFVCDGIITQFWGRQDPQFANLLNINLFFRYAIQLVTNASSMSFVGNYSTIVVEGEPFKNTTIIKVSDSSGNPLKDKLVIATLYMSNGDILPYKYQRVGNGYNKDLVKPIPGTYHFNYSDPFLDDKLMTPIYTDINGTVAFKDLFFSVYGPAGTYMIEFDCEGVKLLSDYIYVVSKVATLKIIIQPSSFVTTDAGTIQSQLNCLIQVVDKNDTPIAGKSPNVKMLRYSGVEFDNANLNLQFDPNNDLYTPSDSYGYIRLYFAFSFAAQTQTNITMNIEIDGISVKTNSFILEYKDGDNQTCGSVIVNYFPSEAHIGEVLNPSPSFQVYNTLGQPLAQVSVVLDSTYSADEVTSFPTDVLPDLRKSGGITTDATGVATFSGFKINQGVFSHMYIQATVFTATDPEYQNLILSALQDLMDYTNEELDQLNNWLDDMISSNIITKCTSKYIRILLKPDLARIEISSYQLSPLLFNGLTINLGTNQTMTLNFYDPYGVMIHSADMPVEIQTIQLPGYMAYTKFVTDTANQPLQMYDNEAVGSDGNMNLKLFVGRGFPGKYAINFKCHGVYSEAVLFKTNFNFKEVQLASNFSSNYDSSVGNPVGIALNQAFIKVIDDNGLSVPNIPVYARIVSGVNSSKAFIDYSEAGEDGDSSIVISNHRLAYTAINGLANFKNLTLIEVTETTCVSFSFYVGDSENYRNSVPTQSFCFKSDATYETYSDLYSKIISMNNPFVQTLKVKVSNNKFSDFLLNGLTVLIAIPYQINGKALMKPLEMAPLYMSNFVCVYNKGSATKASSKICTQLIDVQGSKPYFYIIEMKGLKWIQSAFSTSFYLSISDLFSYVRPNATDSSKFITPNGTKVTGKIEVSNTPDIIQIQDQPSTLIYVGDIFEVSVVCKVSSGSPIVRGNVKAAVVQLSSSSTKSAVSSVNTTLYQTQSLIYGFSEGKVDIDSIGSTSKKTNNILLDSNTAYAKTNRKGIATFNLRILTGLPGDYNIIFSSQQVQSSPSTTFKLLNRISSVTIMQNIETKAQIDVTENLYYRFAKQPKLNITYLENLVDVRNKSVDVLIYKALDQDTINKYQSQLNSSINSTKTNMETLMQQKLSDPNALQTDFMQIGKSLFNAVVNGGKIKRSVERVAENFPIKFDPPTQDSQGNLEFKNLEINFNNVGSFNLIFVVNGIESELSETIVISKPEVTVEDYVISILQKLLVILMSIFVIMANSSYHNHFIWIPLGYGMCIVLLILMDLVEASMIWKVMIYVITAFVLLFLVEVTIQIIFKMKKKGSKTYSMTYNVREEMFYEYTYQMLFKKPSKNWLSANYKNPYDFPPIQTVKNEKQGTQKSVEKQIEMENLEKIDESPLPFGKKQKESQDKPLESKEKDILFGDKKPSLIQKEQYIEFQAVYQTRYEKLKFLQKIKRLFTPFIYNYKQKWVIADCFYFPQRFLTSSLLGACSVAYFAYQFFGNLQGVFQSFGDLGSNIHNSFLVFMGGALTSFKSAFSGTSFDEVQFQKGMNFVNFITDQFTLLAKCLSIGFYVGSSLSLFFFVILLLNTFNSFKRITMEMRRGHFYFPKVKLSIIPATPFIGLQIAVSAVSFLLVSSVVGLVFTVLVHPLLWQFLYENIVFIIVTIAVKLATIILKMTVLKYLMDPFTGVKHRRLFAIYEIISVYLEIIGGLLTALSRIITQMVFGLITLLRIDESILPYWILKRMNIDSANAAFYSALYMYHTHNHPICITFANLLMGIWDQQHKLKKEEKETYFKKRRLANKFSVWYMMVKFPDLIKLRKKRPEKKEEEEKNDKKDEKDEAKKEEEKEEIENEKKNLEDLKSKDKKQENNKDENFPEMEMIDLEQRVSVKDEEIDFAKKKNDFN